MLTSRPSQESFVAQGLGLPSAPLQTIARYKQTGEGTFAGRFIVIL